MTQAQPIAQNEAIQAPEVKIDTDMKDESIKEEVKQEQLPVEQPPQRPIQVSEIQSYYFLKDDKTKCWSCKKKIGLLGMVCRCEYTFCPKHRYPEEHQCDFNFDNFYKKKLEQENQKVAVKKVDKLF